MDSLDLPFDLIWEGKPEPLSPADLALANAEDVLIFDNDLTDDFELMAPEPDWKSERCDVNTAKTQAAHAMLLDLQQQALDIDNDFYADEPMAGKLSTTDGIDDDDESLYDVDACLAAADAEADQWLTQSMNFFPLDAFAAASAASNASIVLPNIVQHSQPPPVKIEQTAQLLREFDSVYEVVELTHLTPPQSPPRSVAPKQAGFTFASHPTNNNIHALTHHQQSHQLHQLHHQQQQQILHQQHQQSLNATGNSYFLFDASAAVQPPVAASPMQPVHDIAHEMEVVEELVRARAEHLPDWQLLDAVASADDDDDCSTSSSLLAAMNHHSLLMPPSPTMSSASSPSCSSSAASSPSRSESSYDADWTPSEESPSSAGSKRRSAVAGTGASAAKSVRRPRPYGRSTEDKKSRKKEQNKNAATRYRQKKKAEIEVALDEERALIKVHDGLQATCADIEREIKYLKNLMRDLYRTKLTVAE